MNSPLNAVLVLLGALVLSACSSVGSNRAPVDEVRIPGNHTTPTAAVRSAPEVPGSNQTDARSTPLPPGGDVVAAPLTHTETTPGAPPSGPNPAVVALVNQANQHTGAGRPALAAASLERAVQIEPANPWLWHRLAVSRRTLGELELAVNLAEKSISLAGAKPRLKAENWRLIAEVRRRQGRANDADIAAGKAQLILAQTK